MIKNSTTKAMPEAESTPKIASPHSSTLPSTSVSSGSPDIWPADLARRSSLALSVTRSKNTIIGSITTAYSTA